MFYCEICEIFKNTYFEEHLRTTTSVFTILYYIFRSLTDLHLKIKLYLQLDSRNLVSPVAIIHIVCTQFFLKKQHVLPPDMQKHVYVLGGTLLPHRPLLVLFFKCSRSNSHREAYNAGPFNAISQKITPFRAGIIMANKVINATPEKSCVRTI